MELSRTPLRAAGCVHVLHSVAPQKAPFARTPDNSRYRFQNLALGMPDLGRLYFLTGASKRTNALKDFPEELFVAGVLLPYCALFACHASKLRHHGYALFGPHGAVSLR